MDHMPNLNTIRTKNEETCEGLKKEDSHEQPLSPTTRLFHEPGFNLYIIGILGFKTEISPDVVKQYLVHNFFKNRRLSSLQVNTHR